MLQQHITDFFSYCKVAGFSPKSIQSLTISLRDFKSFLGTQRIVSADSILYGTLVDFVADFNDPSVHKKKARVWCMHQFFHFLTLTGKIRKNVASGLEYPKIEKTVPHFLTAKEYNLIITYFAVDADSDIGFRNLVMVLMLGMLGLRTSSLISLDIEHIDTENGLAFLHEKGGKTRFVTLPDILVQVLEMYLDSLEHERGPLFLSTRKKRISPRTLQDMFQSAAGFLGFNRKLNPRLFRHTAATLLNKTAGTTITQSVLGHERRANTERYIHLNPDKYGDYMRRHPFMLEGQS